MVSQFFFACCGFIGVAGELWTVKKGVLLRLNLLPKKYASPGMASKYGRVEFFSLPSPIGARVLMAGHAHGYQIAERVWSARCPVVCLPSGIQFMRTSSFVM
jgi:hypothetical protein